MNRFIIKEDCSGYAFVLYDTKLECAGRYRNSAQVAGFRKSSFEYLLTYNDEQMLEFLAETRLSYKSDMRLLLGDASGVRRYYTEQLSLCTS